MEIARLGYATGVRAARARLGARSRRPLRAHRRAAGDAARRSRTSRSTSCWRRSIARRTDRPMWRLLVGAQHPPRRARDVRAAAGARVSVADALAAATRRGAADARRHRPDGGRRRARWFADAGHAALVDRLRARRRARRGRSRADRPARGQDHRAHRRASSRCRASRRTARARRPAPRVAGSVSKRTDFVVAGATPAPPSSRRAQALGIEIIDEARVPAPPRLRGSVLRFAAWRIPGTTSRSRPTTSSTKASRSSSRSRKGSKNKYELDKATGLLQGRPRALLGRALPGQLRLRAAHARGGRRSRSTCSCSARSRSCRWRSSTARAIGAFEMRDEHGVDTKIIAVHVNDPAVRDYHRLDRAAAARDARDSPLLRGLQGARGQAGGGRRPTSTATARSSCCSAADAAIPAEHPWRAAFVALHVVARARSAPAASPLVCAPRADARGDAVWRAPATPSARN